VPANKHLTEDALLLLLTEELPQERLRDAAQHLKACEKCQEQFQEIRRILGAVQMAADRGLLESLSTPKSARSQYPQPGFRFPWMPVTSIIAASIVVLSVLFWPRILPPANASEILDRAVANEHRIEAPAPYSLLANGVPCGYGSKPSPFLLRTNSASCERAAHSVGATVWGLSNPLSAETFRNWHAALADHDDTVEKLPTAWSIRTSTPNGTLREARLTLRLDTYHPIELDLLFRDEQEVVIKEDFTFHPQNPASYSVAASLPQELKNRTKDSSGPLELQAWQLLYDLNADTGWEARVRSDGRGVRVEALVAGEERKRAFEESFKPYPAIRLKIEEFGQPGTLTNIFPHRLSATDGAPPLAHRWLQQQFQDPTAEAQFVTRTVNLSKMVLGRAQFLEEMERQRGNMSDGVSLRLLDVLIAREKQRLDTQESELRAALEPLVGPLPATTKKGIPLAAAHRLDDAVLKLFFVVPSGDISTLDEEQKIVRQSL
jgi:hypothetical protein